ncbi:MAG: HAMP domain-containing protein [Deltaproteobacteria bacterium]|nr:HAMP domain-containing protein [Deltaproteobacteria bacterium]MBW2044445.1 HAMP domain-containing protein [Deltaproteobacteria bacterium]RLB35778.1 MAG: hypothetical protein DRH11_01615 [Deltaproteobacteria bacterium]
MVAGGQGSETPVKGSECEKQGAYSPGQVEVFSAEQSEKKDSADKEKPSILKRVLGFGAQIYPDRRAGRDRRSGRDRRVKQVPFEGPDRRSGKDRRKAKRRIRKLRIPIFFKLSGLSILLILLVISTISLSVLREQKKHFTRQLLDLGQSMIRVASSNAADKILGEEDLAMSKLVNDISSNDQILYALITDHRNVIKAHTKIDLVGKIYRKPTIKRVLKEEKGVRASAIYNGEEECLFFEAPVMYQKLKIGEVYLAISKRRVLENLRNAKNYFALLAIVMALVGVFLSLLLSVYFSHPIRQLGEITLSLGKGDFSRRIKVSRNDEFGDLAYAFNRMASDLELQGKIKDSFGRYVTPEIVEMILSNPDKLWMKGSMVEATVLFVDIRNFTALSENRDPEVVLRLLNDYLTRVTDTVIKYGGHINKFAGDEAMAVFGAPIAKEHHAEAAVKAALEIQREIAELNRQEALRDMTLHIGIGINSGPMVAGNLGSEKRMEYTVIGDNVNVASRLTSIARAGEILITKETCDLIKDDSMVALEGKGKVPVKGRKREIMIYRVLGMEDTKNVVLKKGAIQA